MEENRDSQLEQIEALAKAIMTLPIELQNAICWAVEYYPVLEEIGKSSNMTLEEIQAEMTHALEEKRYSTLFLLYVTKCIRESEQNE